MVQQNPLILMAMARERAGLRDDARSIYLEILDRDGPDSEILRRLGHLDLHDTKDSSSLARFEAALALTPDDLGARFDYGFALHVIGRQDEALACMEGLLAEEPDFAQARYLRARILQLNGEWEESADILKAMLRLEPNNATIALSLGVALVNLKLFGTAAATFRAVIDREPDNVEALHYLGAALQSDGILGDARTVLVRAVELSPDAHDIRQRYADVLFALRDIDGAIRELTVLTEAQPDNAQHWSRLGLVYAEQKRLDDAVEAYERALSLDPDDTIALNNLGLSQIFLGRIEEAVANFRRVLELQPISPSAAGVCSNLLFAMNYLLDVTMDELRLEHRRFEQHTRTKPPAANFVHPNNRDPDRPLRVGYISHDFLHHPVGFFVSSVIVRHNPSQVISYCYSTRPYEDQITWRIKENAKVWRRVVGMEPAEIADLIREDQIDVLVDLSGHTAGNSLEALVGKPAPVQATWAGYVGTTGLSAMDYLIADRFHVPPELEAYHWETVWRMPNGYICYEPPSYAPPVGPLPAERSGRVVFGCFSNPAKINDREIEVWSKIMHQVPGSAIRLRYGNMGTPGNVNRIIGGFTARGIEAERVIIENGGSAPSMFVAYNEVDIALDTFPYSGGLTTCEALWMGVPVVTCPDLRFASRHSLSHLSNSGLTETIARDFDEYVRIAVELAQDLPRLAQMRRTLRATFAASPLSDSDRFTDDLETAFRGMWHRWLEKTAPQG